MCSNLLLARGAAVFVSMVASLCLLSAFTVRMVLVVSRHLRRTCARFGGENNVGVGAYFGMQCLIVVSAGHWQLPLGGRRACRHCHHLSWLRLVQPS